MPQPIRVAYTLEQCWHEVPGGTAVAALRVAEQLAASDQVQLVGVAGRHRHLAPEAWRPQIGVHQLPVARPWLYETWLRMNWPLVESVTGPVDVCHATGLVPAACQAPLVVTVHDLAFVRSPERFSRHGVKVMKRSLEQIKRRADLVLCSSAATVDDVLAAGVPEQRVRMVPLGVDPTRALPGDVERVRRMYGLPDQFVLFVGTLEPRKNLARLTAAVGTLRPSIPLVVAGAQGWGADRGGIGHDANVQFLGFVNPDELAGLYAAATVFAYPSEWEGFGLPVAEAMAQGTPVVTSSGTSTAEVAGGAAVLVDPFQVDDIARGLREALVPQRAAELAVAGLERAAQLTWSATARSTLEAYRELAT